MALQITASCIGCHACQIVCPSGAVRPRDKVFTILADRCNECQGHFGESQCASICPVEGAIVDASGAAMNPIGSLLPIVERPWPIVTGL